MPSSAPWASPGCIDGGVIGATSALRNPTFSAATEPLSNCCTLKLYDAPAVAARGGAARTAEAFTRLSGVADDYGRAGGPRSDHPRSAHRIALTRRPAQHRHPAHG